MVKEFRMYIDGEWIPATDREFYEDFNPYTGEVFARVASGSVSPAICSIVN